MPGFLILRPGTFRAAGLFAALNCRMAAAPYPAYIETAETV